MWRLVHVTLEATEQASDRYRVFALGTVGIPDDKYYWLSGNNKENGAVCRMVLSGDITYLQKETKVYEWGNIPPDQCF